MKINFSKLFIAIFILQIFSTAAVSAQTAQDPNLPPQDFSKIATTVSIHSWKFAPVGDIEKFSSGSATIIDENGLILTNEHVVRDENDDPLETFEICLTFDIQKEPDCNYSASLLATNKELDLALLRIDQIDFQAKQIGKFPFLDYKNPAATEATEIKSGDKIQILGYPNTGKKTITVTQGQVSGFAYENDIRYIKTDAVVSGGNSGGTALDEKGNFIGVPTFLVSREDNLTYILDIKHATDWIEKTLQNQKIKPQTHESAKKILTKKKSLIKSSTQKKKYTHPYYPKFELDLTGKWQIEDLNKEGIVLKNVIAGQETWTVVRIVPSQYKVGKVQLDKIFEELDQNYKYLENYKRIETGFGNLKAWLVTYLSGDSKFHTYFIPYGHALMVIDYTINLKNKKESEKAHEELLKTFKFTEPAVDSLKLLQTFSLDEPPFSIQRTKGWYLQKGAVSLSGYTMLLEISRPDSADGIITLEYRKFSPGQKGLKNKEIFENIVKQYETDTYLKLLAKDGNVKVDGLSGWSLTTSFPGKGIETKKQTQLYLRNGEYYFLFTYTDKDKNYDKYIEDFKKIISTFKFGEQKDQIIEPTPLEEFGTLNNAYQDITYHRYENDIAELREKGYFSGDYMEEYSKERFGPERFMARGEAIFLLIEMKFRFDERKNNLGKRDEEARDEVVQYKYNERADANFRDTRKSFHPMQYIRYAKAKGYVKGDTKKKKFYPYHPVTLAEFLSMAFRVFEVPLWETKNKSIEWHKIFMDKAYEKGLIPAGIFDIDFEKKSSSSTFVTSANSTGSSVGSPSPTVTASPAPAPAPATTIISSFSPAPSATLAPALSATHPLTRGEFSYIINQLLMQLGDN